jgi:hypothetical protein
MRRILLLVCCLSLFAIAGFSTECTNGDYRWADTGSCCGEGGILLERQFCSGGSWVGTGTFACGPFIPGCPPPQ